VPELDTPTLKRSVFVLPANFVKGNRARVLVLNDPAQTLLEEVQSEGNTGAMYLHSGMFSRAGLFGRPSGQVGKQPEREPLDITRPASAPQRRRDSNESAYMTSGTPSGDACAPPVSAWKTGRTCSGTSVRKSRLTTAQPKWVTSSLPPIACQAPRVRLPRLCCASWRPSQHSAVTVDELPKDRPRPSAHGRVRRLSRKRSART
jgi:hypothetical protein